MSSRIIRSSDAANKARVSSGGMPGSATDTAQSDRAMAAEKQAFEQGYREGERSGKQMGERMVEDSIKRYERGIQQLAGAHRALTDAMEVATVRLSLEIAKKILQREITLDPDLVAVMVSVALKRVNGHHGVAVRVSNHDYARVCEALRSSNASIPVQEDPSRDRGDFLIDTTQTHLDGRIASQIETVGRALFDE